MPVIVLPEPAAPPVIPPVTEGAVQVYVVPAGMVFPPPFAGVTEKPVPLQVVTAWFVIVATGFIVTATFCVLEHPLAVRV